MRWKIRRSASARGRRAREGQGKDWAEGEGGRGQGGWAGGAGACRAYTFPRRPCVIYTRTNFTSHPTDPYNLGQKYDYQFGLWNRSVQRDGQQQYLLKRKLCLSLVCLTMRDGLHSTPRPMPASVPALDTRALLSRCAVAQAQLVASELLLCATGAGRCGARGHSLCTA